jgi:hypothetical protein
MRNVSGHYKTKQYIEMKKRIALLLITLVFSPRIFCQTDFQKYEISVGGNYRKNSKDLSIGSYKTNMKTNCAKFEFAINRAISSKIMVGFGLNYLLNKEQFDYSYYNADNGFIVEDYPEIESKTIIPSVNLKYVKALSDRLFIGLNLNNGYGFCSSEKNSITKLKVNFLVSDLTGSYKGYEEMKDESFYTISLEPEICYYLTNSLGIKFKGDFYRFDTINKNQFFFDTKSNQILWTFGLNWKI